MEYYVGHIILVLAGTGMACGGFMEVLAKDPRQLPPVLLGLIGLMTIALTFAHGLIALGEKIR